MMRRLEAMFVWYGLTIAVLILLFGQALEARWAWLVAHVAIIVPATMLSRWGRLGPRLVAACVLTPAAFSTLGLILPDLVPEPVHWDVSRFDTQLGGAWVRELFSQPWMVTVEISQLAYATFYFLPIGLGIALLLQGRKGAALQVAEVAVGGLLLSYLGYLVLPTLPPYRFLAYEHPLVGGPTFDWVHRLLFDLEALREDCMPSGHTMVTILVLMCAWRFDKRQWIWLMPLAVPLVVATVALRYHWWADLVAAVPFALLARSLFWREVVEERGGAERRRASKIVPSR
ncbi:MAG: phosphatase PAP2 family protein [Planctomycetes bacterium]|nr:phosphatase PAP2 family protein [Planctomycetota bacterium]